MSAVQQDGKMYVAPQAVIRFDVIADVRGSAVL